MGFFRKNLSNDLVPIDPDNISNKDWVILLEAGTIIGPSPQRIRVARWMQEKKIVKKYDMFLRTKYFIVVEGFLIQPDAFSSRGQPLRSSLCTRISRG